MEWLVLGHTVLYTLHLKRRYRNNQTLHIQLFRLLENSMHSNEIYVLKFRFNRTIFMIDESLQIQKPGKNDLNIKA